MGKIKKRRQQGQRYNPMVSGQEGRRDGDMEQQASSRNHTSSSGSAAGLRVVEEKVGSTVVEERVCGLNTLASLALEEAGPSCLVGGGSQLVSRVSLLLRDPSAEVRLAAAGALRNISAGGSDEVVRAMVQQDVLGPLAELLATYRDTWAPATNDLGQETPREEDPITNTFTHATHLLWNLCECSEEAMNAFNREGLIHVLLRHLDPSTWGHTMAQAVAECLLCVSENNPSATSVLLPLADDLVGYISRLHEQEQPTSLHFATTVVGTLLNIGYCTTGSNSFQLVLKVLSATLGRDPLPLVCRYASDSLGSGDVRSTITPQELEHLILGQQLALEILSNISCAEDDEDWDECDDAPSGDEEEIVCDGDTAMSDDGARMSLPPELHEGIRHFSLFEKTLNKVVFPEEEVVQALLTLKFGPSLVTKLGVLRTRALVCLQNMSSGLEVCELGGPDLLYSTWLKLGSILFQQHCSDGELQEAATGAMRAIIDRLRQERCDSLASITMKDLQPIFEVGVSCALASVRANLTRMVGSLGCLLVAQSQEDALTEDNLCEVLSSSTEFLFKVGARDGELWVCAEALDVIIDLYSDDKTDKLAHQVHLVDRLRGIQPDFKAKHHRQRKRLGDHRPLVLTVRDNLGEFIKYKGPRAAKYSKT